VNKPRRALALATAVVALLSAVAVLPANADHEDGSYEIPSFSQYDTTHLSVLVVPPNHGQIFNGETGILNGSDPDELTPFNSYLVAIEAAIQAWEDAVKVLGADWLKTAYDVKVYVLGRDSVPTEVATQPDILVITDEDQGFSLGTAIRLRPCIVRMSKYELMSFTWADMYNVTAQEFGHCLGIQHVGSQGGVDPTSEQKHPEHDVMNGFYTHPIGEKGTHLHCISNLDILALEWTFGHVNPSLLATAGPGATSFMSADFYGDTCSLPPADWRDYASHVPDAPAPEPSPSPSEEPAEAASSTISSPAHGESLARERLKKISGTATTTDSRKTTTHVALAQIGKKSCSWWSFDRERFVKGSCSDPLWATARGDANWQKKVGARLPAGRYRAMAIAETVDGVEMCCEEGRNLVEFRLT
jgi:hypothetical protein